MTKDPIGHKGSRLTAQISLPGRFLVYVPDGSMTGISRKLPDTERTRLKAILKEAVPEGAGVIVRTAAEGASEEELSRDVARLTAQWEDIAKKAKTGTAPALLYGEPDLAVRVIRDVFNEDVNKLVVSGDDAWDMIQPYLGHVAPDLVDRLSRWTEEKDVFAAHRVDEQLAKALDRKVWLPSGGSLVIDRTEAMTVVDVNTGKFIGAGGNLEETVTRNNLEAAEEIVRQLRLRDVGGIIVVDFIDMVLESNRDLVLRRLLECLSRDRTKHQVAEVTSLGLVQMTRKRVGQGLIEAFSVPCEHCGGRGVMVQMEPVDLKAPKGGPSGVESDRPGRRKRGAKAKPEAPAGRTHRRGGWRGDRGAHGPGDTRTPTPTPSWSRSPRLVFARRLTTGRAQGELGGHAGLRGWPPPPTLEPDLGNASGGNHGSAPSISSCTSRSISTGPVLVCHAERGSSACSSRLLLAACATSGPVRRDRRPAAPGRSGRRRSRCSRTTRSPSPRAPQGLRGPHRDHGQGRLGGRRRRGRQQGGPHGGEPRGRRPLRGGQHPADPGRRRRRLHALPLAGTRRASARAARRHLRRPR